MLIAIASFAGLIWALLVDGSTDAIASLMVGVPILALLLMRKVRK